MSVPVEMLCLKDECPSPLTCHSRGGCREERRDAYLSYGEALSECRARGLVPKSWRSLFRKPRPIEEHQESYWS